MKDSEKDSKYEEFLKLLEESLSSENDTTEATPAIHSTQQKQAQRNSMQQGHSPPGPASPRGAAHLSEQPEDRSQPSKKPKKHISPKRKAAKKRRQRHMIIITAIPVVVLILSILLIVKSCSGGDVLKGTWDLDGVTVYQFNGKGNGSLNLPSNSYPFKYEIKDNAVSIDFESVAARDVTYTFTVEEEKLLLVRVEKGNEITYELTKKSGG